MRNSVRESSGTFLTNQFLILATFVFVFGLYLNVVMGVPTTAVNQLTGMMLAVMTIFALGIELLIKYRPGWLHALADAGYVEVSRDE